MLLFDFPVNVIKKTFKLLGDPFLAAYPFHQSRVFPMVIFHGGGAHHAPLHGWGGTTHDGGAGEIFAENIAGKSQAQKVEILS